MRSTRFDLMLLLLKNSDVYDVATGVDSNMFKHIIKAKLVNDSEIEVKLMFNFINLGSIEIQDEELAAELQADTSIYNVKLGNFLIFNNLINIKDKVSGKEKINKYFEHKLLNKLKYFKIIQNGKSIFDPVLQRHETLVKHLLQSLYCINGVFNLSGSYYSVVNLRNILKKVKRMNIIGDKIEVSFTSDIADLAFQDVSIALILNKLIKAEVVSFNEKNLKIGNVVGIVAQDNNDLAKANHREISELCQLANVDIRLLSERYVLHSYKSECISDVIIEKIENELPGNWLQVRITGITKRHLIVIPENQKYNLYKTSILNDINGFIISNKIIIKSEARDKNAILASIVINYLIHGKLFAERLAFAHNFIKYKDNSDSSFAKQEVIEIEPSKLCKLISSVLELIDSKVINIQVANYSMKGEVFNVN